MHTTMKMCCQYSERGDIASESPKNSDPYIQQKMDHISVITSTSENRTERKTLNG